MRIKHRGPSDQMAAIGRRILGRGGSGRNRLPGAGPSGSLCGRTRRLLGARGLLRPVGRQLLGRHISRLEAAGGIRHRTAIGRGARRLTCSSVGHRRTGSALGRRCGRTRLHYC